MWGDFLITLFSKVFLFFFWFNMLVLISNFCVALADEFWGKMRILLLRDKSLRYQNVRPMFALYCSKIMEMTVCPGSYYS